jgi:hypothetical protein
MKTLLTSGLFWFAVFLIFVVIFAYVLKRWGEVTLRNARCYDELYREIQNDLWHLPVNADNCDLIQDKLGKLAKMPYRNPEKISVLRHSFNKRFLVPRLQEVIETNLKKKR